MDTCAGIGLFICLVIIVIVGIASKINIDCDIEYLKSKVEYLNIINCKLDYLESIFYKSLNKRCDDMFNIIKMQQEEIKELRRMIEPKDEKKCCCGNCRFYHELNDQDSICLNVHVNKCHKSETAIYFNNRSVSYGTVKGVKPNECCEWYEPKEVSDER